MLIQIITIISLLILGQPQRQESTLPSLQSSMESPTPHESTIPETDASAPPPTGATFPEIGTWLVHLASHEGHLLGRENPRSASLHVMSLLIAATEVSPDCAEAYFWLYDLRRRLGQPEKSRKALEAYVRLSPDDQAAAMRLFELELQGLQTAESRADFVKEQLLKKPLSPALGSRLHDWLADHYYELHENSQASREIERALRLDPMNISARRLAYKMFGETEPALQRVETALQLIRINPTQATLVWELAEFLDRLSLHVQAQEWYNRAIDLHLRSDVGPVPAERWHRLAVSYFNTGDYAKAKEAIDHALRIDPGFSTARLLRANALTHLEKPQAAAADVAVVAKAYASHIDEVIQEKRFDEAARIAWFYCYHQPKPSLAMKLAKLAMEDHPPSELARVAYGYALKIGGHLDEAIDTLKPLAVGDQLAAYELARAQIEQDHTALAITTLYKAATIQYSGIAYELISDLLKKYDQTPPQPPLHTKIIAALDKFKRDIFDYPHRPQDFLKFSIRFEKQHPEPVDPIRVTFRIENIGSFPITFGEGFMARPLVALSAKIGGQTGRAYDNYLQVLMNSRSMLRPGEFINKTIAIDVGLLRKQLIEDATDELKIELSALFDPVYQKGRLTAGMGTLSAGPIAAIRPAIDVSPEGLASLFKEAKSTDSHRRIRTADRLGAILASVRATRATHSSQKGVPAQAVETPAEETTLSDEAVSAALVPLLGDDDWRVRCHAINAIGWSKLDHRLTVAAAACVRDENPIVKLLAVRLFAEQHGEKFKRVLVQLRNSDPSPAIRMMAASFLADPSDTQVSHAPDDIPD